MSSAAGNKAYVMGSLYKKSWTVIYASELSTFLFGLFSVLLFCSVSFPYLFCLSSSFIKQTYVSDKVWKAKAPYKLNGLQTKKTYTTQDSVRDAVMKSKGKYKG